MLKSVNISKKEKLNSYSFIYLLFDKIEGSFLRAAYILISIIIFGYQGCDFTTHAESELTSPITYSILDTLPIFKDEFGAGFSLGVNTSKGLTDWISINHGVLEMDYPEGQNWGAVFITVGEPTDPPHPSMDLSGYNRLSLELCGKNGEENVWIGVKDHTDPDDGSEIQVRIFNISTDWHIFELPLSQFYTADFDSIYVPIEFVFDGEAKTIFSRNIQYLP